MFLLTVIANTISCIHFLFLKVPSFIEQKIKFILVNELMFYYNWIGGLIVRSASSTTGDQAQVKMIPGTPNGLDGEVDAYLNVASVCKATRVLGPGLRSVVWVQGCVFRCPGCIAPDWIPLRPAFLVKPEELVDILLADPEVRGITFSGGEPMLQAANLARLARLARERRELSIICFSGYQKEALEKNPPGPGVSDLFDQIDVLIDGPYIARLDNNRGLRGSTNQKIHYLTNRLRGLDLENQPRKIEINIVDGQASVVGIPTTGVKQAFQQALDHASHHQWELVKNERV